MVAVGASAWALTVAAAAARFCDDSERLQKGGALGRNACALCVCARKRERERQSRLLQACVCKQSCVQLCALGWLFFLVWGCREGGEEANTKGK